MLGIACMRLHFDLVTSVTFSKMLKCRMSGRMITPGARRGYVTGTMATLNWACQYLDSSAAAAARLNNLPADQRATVTMFGSLLFC